MGLVFSSKEFDLGNLVSKSVLQDDMFAWFAEEFVDVMPEFADITRSNGEISAFVDNRELVLTVIDIDSETGMKTPARSICKPYSNPAVQRINGVTNVAIWEICAYENDLMVDLPSKLINSCCAYAYVDPKLRPLANGLPSSQIASDIRKAASSAVQWLSQSDWSEIFLDKLPDNAKIVKQSEGYVIAQVVNGNKTVTIKFDKDQVYLSLYVEHSMSDQIYGVAQPSFNKLTRSFNSEQQLAKYDLQRDIDNLMKAGSGRTYRGSLGT